MVNNFGIKKTNSITHRIKSLMRQIRQSLLKNTILPPFAADRLCPSALLRCVFVYENLKVKYNEKEI